MSKMKLVITSVLILFLCFLSYLFFASDEEHEIEQALSYYLKNNYKKASSLIEGIDTPHLELNKLLYLAYLARDQGDLEASNAYLTKASKLAKFDTRRKLKLEVTFNLALNGYLEGNDAQLTEALIAAKEITGEFPQEWITFFKSLQMSETNLKDYLNLPEAQRKYWEKMEEKIPLSLWMNRSFGKVFNPYWKTFHEARYNINNGNYIEARQLIQTALATAVKEEKNELNFLMAKSYSKEALDKPPTASVPYYKLAFSYYDKIPTDKIEYLEEKEFFFKQAKNQINVLIESKNFKEIIFFINLLKKYDSHEDIKQLTSKLLVILQEQITNNEWATAYDLLALLQRTLPDGEKKAELENQLEKNLIESINTGNIQGIKSYWKALITLNPSINTNKTQYSQLIRKKLMEMTTGSKEEWLPGLQMLSFLSTIEKEVEGRKELSKQLINSASKLWDRPGRKEDALLLLRVSIKLSEKNYLSEIQETIQSSLRKEYEYYFKNDRFEILPYLLNASKVLNLGSFTLIQPEEIKEYIKEAETLFSEKKFDRALNLAEWSIVLSPQDKKALTIAGLINYYRGYYRTAESYLSQVKIDNKEMEKALVISQILSKKNDSQGKKRLVELEKQGLFSENTYLRLGFGELMNEDPLAALSWFNQLDGTNPEVMIGKAIAAFQEKNWDDATKHLQNLPSEYANLEKIVALKMLINFYSYDIEGIKSEYNKLMNNETTSSESHYSQPFRIYTRKMLRDYNKYFMSSLYYEKVKSAIDEAILQLSFIKSPTPTLYMRLGSLSLKKNDYKKAKENYLKALNLAKTTPETENLQATILSKLANVSTKQGQYIDAYLFYKDYYDIKQESKKFRSEYANALLNVRKYKTALKQFLFLKEHDLFKPEYNLPLIETYIHLNRFGEANDTANQWVEKNNSITILNLLKLGQHMIVTRNETIINYAMGKLTKATRLSTLELIELIKLLIYQGNFIDAKNIVEEKLQEIEKTSEGLMGLAQFYLFYSDKKKAVEYAEKALQLDPQNITIQQFIDTHRRDISLTDLTKRLMNFYTQDDHLGYDYDDRLTLIHTILEKSIQEVLINPNLSFHTIPELIAILDHVIELSKELNHIPEVQLYMGQLYYLLDNLEKAEEFYTNAIDLDISYALAHQYLGLLYLKSGQFNQAEEELLTALRFEPYHADAWYLLGRTNEELNANYDALRAYNNSMKFKPNSPQPYIQIARLQLGINNPEAAINTLQLVLSIDPDNIQALKLLLLAFYNPHIYFEGDEQGRVTAQRIQVEEKLREIAPDDLKELLIEIKSKEDYEPIRKMVFPY